MQRLTGLDAGFLYMETPTQHLHTLKIAILDPTTVPGGYAFDKVREVLAQRIHLLPPFRRRLVEVPFSLHHPLWIEDPDFDLDAHVRRVAVPAPGGPEQLDELVSSIASTPLDRRRPLWEIWVVEGLEDGNIGFVTKIHHCAADGVLAAELLVQVLDTSPEITEPPPPAQPWRPEPVPSSSRLILDALVDLARLFATLPGLLRRTVSGLRAVTQRRRSGAPSPPPPFSAPSLSFNASLTPHRWYVSTSLSLAEVKAVKTAFDATVNDVVLAVCAGALRRYLEDRGEPVDRPLLIGVPVSTRTEGRGQLANSVSNLFTSLPVDLTDPGERLAVIHEGMAGAKEQHNVLGAEMLRDWSEITPPRPFAAVVGLYSRHGLADRHRPPINLVVSNVPGPPVPLFVAGAKLAAIYSMGPILENIGLNITVWSYLGDMFFGIVGCRERNPDLRRLAEHLHDALDELAKAAAAAPPTPGK
ncbi:MAG: wax ester/triacylglycerol synthase family O-acyltransferase [Actinomycetota bacterium]|nr:wax ester/triacylglycerol synthase family O-acyltransferase [Actinomycetota bacterium]